jgi:ribulose-5-phosphate 4-epimerase/fuculose-1-phosphate aldolase
MVTVNAIDTSSVRSSVSEAEWTTRVELAACYRLTALEGWTDLTATHISARVPDEDAFLLNPCDLYFEEITASSLVKMDYDRNIVLENGYYFNPAAFTIHSAILTGRKDATCAIHTHTRAGMAISAMKCGLLPITQHALRFYNRTSYHKYEGIALDPDERARLIADMSTHEVMILENHGLLSVGNTIGNAFDAMFYLEKSCQSQLDAMRTGTDLILPDPDVCEHAAQQYEAYESYQDKDWAAAMRKAHRDSPGFDQ